MKALVWHGKEDVRIDVVPDPTIVDSNDVIVKITATVICGSDLHLYDGSIDAIVDKAKQTVKLGTDRSHVLHEAIYNCRKGGTVSVPGVYIGLLDKIPFGAAMNKGLTFKMGQTHVQRYSAPLLKMIENGEIDPSFVITHTVGLDDAPEMYRTFRDKKDGCIKVILKPDLPATPTAPTPAA